MTAALRASAVRIARGNTSDVWTWSERTVVKVLRAGIPDHWAMLEAETVAQVHAAGLPVPETEGVIEFDGRPGIVLERIDGMAMWERMRTDPRSVPDLIIQLVDLQSEVQANDVPGLASMDSRLRTKISDARQLPHEDRRAAQELLDRLPVGKALCHGDFHPANIILTERGPVILDWFDAATGHVMADYVRSSLLMRPPFDRSSWLAGSTPELLDQIHSHYITELVRRSSLDASAFGAWEAVTAVARMSEPVPDMDLLAVWERWQAREPAAVRMLIEHSQERAAASMAPAGGITPLKRRDAPAPRGSRARTRPSADRSADEDGRWPHPLRPR
jgi:aminoglycoside phosphotransferase (APT) family kinase protein